jgi:glycine/D-amino acid oxidase-like deaminating enzyme
MRILLVGGGIAGATLAWRLAADHRVDRVDVVTGFRRVDASRVSGGVVRSFEPHPVQRHLAAETLRVLRDDPVLRSWARYAEAESLYVTEGQVPEQARTLDAGRLAGLGWSGLPEHARGVHEPSAGWIDPAALRDALLADLRSRRNVRTAARDLDAGARTGRHDAVVVAAGPWSPRVLRRLGLPTGDLVTKAIQYGVYRVDGWRPPCFVDETTGLYGRPVGAAEMLLGVPMKAWAVDPDRTSPDLRVEAGALRLASLRLPGLRLGSRTRLVASTDCYHPEPYLALRPAADTSGRTFTFTGGSGGSAKTVLAASARAAADLVTSVHQSRHLTNGVPR